tara:strand:- start:6623 stop:6874 length:252 start_codon:yes stop_codon:yes gene_type:complete
LHYFLRGRGEYYRLDILSLVRILNASDLDCGTVVARPYGVPKRPRPNKDRYGPTDHNKNGIPENIHSVQLPTCSGRTTVVVAR